MASSTTTNLEERFNIAVKTIQNLPPDGALQPSNMTKLIFYGLYKQATLGPCKEAKPSMFNYVARAKWEAWDRCRAMTKEQAMLAYIDEIRKIIETMPQTAEVLEIAKSMGISNEPIDDKTIENDTIVVTETVLIENTQSPVNTNDSIETVIEPTGNDSVPSLTSSSSSSSSSISSSDIDEFYDDPSDLLSLEMTSNTNHSQHSSNANRHLASSHSHGAHNISIRQSTRNTTNHSNISSTHLSTFRHHTPSNEIQHLSSSDDDIINQHLPNNYNKQTQRAILIALTNLQRDIHNILERLNRLETAAYLLQQRELLINSQINSSSKWLPLSGFRRQTIAFVLLWPFLAYILVRLLLRAKIIIRFRR